MHTVRRVLFMDEVWTVAIAEDGHDENCSLSRIPQWEIHFCSTPILKKFIEISICCTNG